MVFLNEIRQNLRLRLGLWFVLGIILSYCLLLLYDEEAELISEYQKAILRLQQIQQVIAQPEWIQHRQVINNQLIQLESKLWQANTEGLAQANLQAWLETQAKSLKIKSFNIKIDPVIKLSELAIWQLKAQLEGDFEQTSFYDLLLTLDKSQQWLIVERLDISTQSKKPHFQMNITAYFQADGI